MSLAKSGGTLLLQFLDGLKAIWVRPGSASFLHTSFIVLGPIPEENSYHLTTGMTLNTLVFIKYLVFSDCVSIYAVDQLLETVAGCLSKDAVLLVVRPLQISNKDVTNLFCSYKPPQPRLYYVVVILKCLLCLCRNSSVL